jgi:acyl transferase domain-containing protein/acyl carrier protein/NAD(P)-dependent dehydrogenase (short-subunit alcohol dehydrogenase family)
MSTRESRPKVKSGNSQVPIAVIGMACRLPGAKNLQEYWDLIISGKDVTGELPEDFFDRELFFDPEEGVRGKSYTTKGALVDEVPFTTIRSKLTNKELKKYDNVHLSMCELAAESLRDARYDPFNLQSRKTGVFFGTSGNTTKVGNKTYSTYIERVVEYLKELKSLSIIPEHELQEISNRVVDKIRERFSEDPENYSEGSSANLGSELVTKLFNLDGPSVAVEAACASSLQSLMLAVHALRQDKLDMAIVGSASCCKSDTLVLFSAARSVTNGITCPFDDSANGLVPAEGFVSFVLKTLPKAIEDGDNIRCVIQGLGMSSDGKGKSLWAPRSEGQVFAMERAYQNGLHPQDIQYIEAHATSTQVGDATELEALAKVIGNQTGKKIPLGAVKGNIGHTLESAGAASLVKMILAIENEIIPPIANLKTPNQSVPWNDYPFYLPTHAESWPRPDLRTPRRGAVNAFGIGGMNVHVVVEEYIPELDKVKLQENIQAQHDIPANEPIAIVGTGAIVPGAHSVDAFWELLQSGKSTISKATDDRIDSKLYLDTQDRKRYRTTGNSGGFVTDYKYDWRRHKVPPKQVDNANPLQFMLLDATEQALKQAGYPAESYDKERIGVVIGCMFGGDFMNQLQAGLRQPNCCDVLSEELEQNSIQKEIIEQAVVEFTDRLVEDMPALIDETGSFTSSTLASRITKTFDIKGGALSINSGNTSSLAALDACISILRSGSCDTMICAGGQRAMDIVMFEEMSSSGILANSISELNSEKHMPGEGCGVLILKRLTDAKKDGNKILGVVHGVGMSRQENPSEAIKSSLSQTLQAYQQPAADLSFIESPNIYPQITIDTRREITNQIDANRSSSVPIGSLVNQFGYLGSAHSMLSIIKACEAHEHGTIPADLGSQRSQIKLNSNSLIGISDTSKSGSSYHTIIESPNRVVNMPKKPSQMRTTVNLSQPSKIVRLGGKNWNALHISLNSLSLNEIASLKNPFQSIDRVRLAFVFETIEQLKQQISLIKPEFWKSNLSQRENLASNGIYYGESSSEKSRCAFVFPGQGSSYPGMLSELIAVNPYSAKHAEQVDAAMRDLGLESFREISDLEAELDISKDIWQKQISVLLADSIFESTLRDLGLNPSIVAGHSFGEYPALVSAGAWSLTDAIRATHRRFKTIVSSGLPAGRMAATDAPLETIQSVLDQIGDGIHVANVNASDQIVISGYLQHLNRAIDSIKKAQLFAEVGERFNIAPRADLSLDDFPTLGDVLNFLIDELGGDSTQITQSTTVESITESPMTQAPVVNELKQEVIADSASSEGSGTAAAELQDILVGFVVEQTGYPEEIVEMDVDLEADLGIDSIKKAQLFAEVGERFNLAPRADLSLDDFPTLGHVLNFLIEELGVDSDQMTQLTNEESVTEEPISQAPVVNEIEEVVDDNASSDGSVAAVEELHDILVGFVVEQTGYPEEIVEMDVDLEADLGIDSIKKAQLFAEVGERFNIAPRADLSLDDFPTLGHVLDFLIDELGLQSSYLSQSKSASSHPTTAVGNATVKDVESEGIKLTIFTGTSKEEGSIYQKEIQQGLYSMADQFHTEEIVRPLVWKGSVANEIHSLAEGANCNDKSLYAYNQRIEPLHSWRLTFSPDSNINQLPHIENSSLLIRKYSPSKGLNYCSLGRPGKRILRAGINSAKIAVSCEVSKDKIADASLLLLNDTLHEVLANCQDIESAVKELSSLNLQDGWCLGVSSSVSSQSTFLHYDGTQIHRSQKSMSKQQEAYHKSLIQSLPILEMIDQKTGYRSSINLAEILDFTPTEVQSKSTLSPYEPDNWVMKRYVLKMLESHLAVTPDSINQPIFKSGDCVLLLGDSSIAAQLINDLSREGCRVHHGSGKQVLSRFETLLHHELPRHVILLNAACENAETLSDFDASEYYLETFLACQKWIDLLIEKGMLQGSSLSSISRMGGDFGLNSIGGNFVGGGYTGFLKGLRREYPELKIRAVDFENHVTAPSIVSLYLSELNGAGKDLEVGFIQGKRHTIKTIPEVAPKSPPQEIPRGGVWVITGGGRGVTCEVARGLASRYALKLHLFGTAPLPNNIDSLRNLTEAQLKELKKETAINARKAGNNPAHEWRKIEKANELDKNIHRYAEAGVQAVYHSVDITDRSALANKLDEIRRTDGQINGIIHGAGVEAACKFTRKKQNSVDATISSKCTGASNLFALTRNDNLQYFIGFGSTSGRFGGVGQTDYSLASDLLAKMTGKYATERPECKVVCFHWPAWDEVGMAVRPESKVVLKGVGMEFMPTKEGLAHVINELVSGTPEREVLIVDKPKFVDTDELLSFSSGPDLTNNLPRNNGSTSESSSDRIGERLQDLPLIESVRKEQDGSTYIATAILNSSTDPFLYEHRYKETPLLPAVFALELFAEAVASLNLTESVVGYRDLQLTKGLLVNPSSSREVQIKMQKVPGGIKCELFAPFKHSSGHILDADKVYSSALLELSNEPVAIDKADPGKPLHGWKPFVYHQDVFIIHGPPFHTFKSFDYIHAGGRGEIEGLDPKTLLGPNRTGDMKLACATLDGCIVLCGVFLYVMCEAIRGLPRSLDYYRQVRIPQTGEKCKAKFTYREDTNGDQVFDLFLVGEQGDMIFEFKGYRIGVLESL